ncbi:MAG: DUF438 domain-containing protein [Candidatus Eisenbacteria bacterium]
MDRAERIQSLKSIIRQLHAGAPPDRVREALKTIVRETTAAEIAAMEQELIAEGMPVSEVQAMCDLHSALVRELLMEAPADPQTPGHPLDTFQRENEALREAVSRARRGMAAFSSAVSASERQELLLAWRGVINELLDVEKHYQRKEQILFPFLERHGITGPTSVMWGKDDEVRRLLKGTAQALSGMTTLRGTERDVWAGFAEPALNALEEMITKEEKILLPLAAQKLSPEEWGEIWLQSPEYGWCLVEPRVGYRPPVPAESPGAADASAAEAAAVGGMAGGIRLDTGRLSLAQLQGVLALLPIDFTFVDSDDRVAFFSPGRERVFGRSKAILGRKVQHCHPPKSLAIVERILADFRGGRQNSAEFWIEMQGRFIHIRYYAVRAEQGEYLGTLEVTQDATRIRALKGEQRLLQYGGPDYTGG